MKPNSTIELKRQAKMREWRERIMDCRSQDISVKQWCAEQNIKVSTYYRWEREIFGKLSEHKEREKGEAHTAEFAALPAPTSESMCRTEESGHRVVAGISVGERKVEIYSGADAETVGILLKALGIC